MSTPTSADTRRTADIARIVHGSAAFYAARKQAAESLETIAGFSSIPFRDPSGRDYEYELTHYDPEEDAIITVCTVFETEGTGPTHLDVAGREYNLRHGRGRHCYSFNIHPAGAGEEHHH